MKNFLAVYLGSSAGMEHWKAMDEASRKDREKTGKSVWTTWAIENQKSIVDHGSPLGKTKTVNKTGISDTKNELTAYTIVRAHSHEAAAEMFRDHPHFSVFPGDAVEIMECLPMPKM
jgi:hypothetical protein